MRKLFKRRPSGAMIVAVAALTMALVGTGIAASALTKKQKKQTKTSPRTSSTTSSAGA